LRAVAAQVDRRRIVGLHEAMFPARGARDVRGSSWRARCVAVGWLSGKGFGMLQSVPREGRDPLEQAHATAGTVFVNANVHTLDAAQPRAQAIAARGGRIVAVGSTARVLRDWGREGEVVDLGGRTVLPGLIDAHAHLIMLGEFLRGRMDLSDARSFDDIVQRVRRAAERAAPGQWIIGGRWDQTRWADVALPTHAALSAVSAQNPVWLRRVDGHAGLANALALRHGGLTRASSSPPGGEIVRDGSGEPTGLLIDRAMELVEGSIGRETEIGAAILAAQEVGLSTGLTGVHDAWVTPAEAEEYERLARAGKLKLRVYGMLDGSAARRFFAQHGLIRGPRFTLRAAKLFADGALGSRGAWLYEPYCDRPADDAGRPYVGLNLTSPEAIREAAAEALSDGYQLCTHAIGDRAVHETLCAYEAALDGRKRSDHRFRIEHVQLLAEADVQRFAALGVIASVQPTHYASDRPWLTERVGAARAKRAYPWADLLRAGARLAGGSDFPVESPNAFLGMYAAVTRQAAGCEADQEAADQRLTRTEALHCFTLGAAHAAFEEHEKGSLAPGKLADLVVTDRDPLTCDVEALAGTRVLRTYMGAEQVYGAPGEA
jgi:predicted amidohydrolase YtcJ